MDLTEKMIVEHNLKPMSKLTMWIFEEQMLIRRNYQLKGSKSRMCLLSLRNSEEVSVVGPWGWGMIL